jgi:hypothetical protein
MLAKNTEGLNTRTLQMGRARSRLRSFDRSRGRLDQEDEVSLEELMVIIECRRAL